MAKKLVIPVDFKYDFAMRSYANLHRAYLYAIREKYGAAAALEIYESTCKTRLKGLTNNLLNIFNIEGNDAETIAKWWDIFWELTGGEWTWPERSKTIVRWKLTKCAFKLEPKDISDWCKHFADNVVKTINPKATSDRLKGMCAGDPYCEYVWKIEE